MVKISFDDVFYYLLFPFLRYIRKCLSYKENQKPLCETYSRIWSDCDKKCLNKTFYLTVSTAGTIQEGP